MYMCIRMRVYVYRETENLYTVDRIYTYACLCAYASLIHSHPLPLQGLPLRRSMKTTGKTLKLRKALKSKKKLTISHNDVVTGTVV